MSTPTIVNCSFLYSGSRTSRLMRILHKLPLNLNLVNAIHSLSIKLTLPLEGSSYLPIKSAAQSSNPSSQATTTMIIPNTSDIELNSGFPAGYFVIQNVATKRLLDVTHDAIEDGTEINLWPEKEKSLVESMPLE